LVYSGRILNKNLNYETTVLKTNPFLTFSNNIRKLNTKRTRSKILKTSLLLLIPWLIFFAFYFSYNSYYFGEAQTNYRDVKNELVDVSNELVDGKESLLLSFFKFDSDRFDAIKYRSIGFMPDRMKYGLADLFSIEDASFTETIRFQNIIEFVDNNWVAIFMHIIILSAVGISFIYKVKRIEVSVLFFLILGTLLVFTAGADYDNVEISSGETQERYMIFNLVFSSMLFGFVMIKVYEIKFNKISISKRRFVSNGFKIIFLLILGLLLFVSIFYSTPMIDIYRSNFEIRDLSGYVLGFPIESGLPEKSIVVSLGRVAIVQGVIPFDTHYTVNDKFEPSDRNDDDILMLIDRMNEGYTVYTLKDSKPKVPKFFRYLEAEHGLILKSFNNQYCKMERLTIDVDSNTESDDICYTYDGIFYPKLG